MENSTHYIQSSHEKEASSSSAFPSAFYQEAHPALGRTKQKNFRESISYHWFTFAATFHGKAEVVPPTLAGAGTYLFRLSGYGFRWSRIRVIIKKNKKEWRTVLLASILLCDEDVTLALPCVCVPPCTLPSQRWLKLFQEISNRKSGYEQNSLLICNGFPFFYPFLYAKQGWRFDGKAHLLGFGFDYHI